MVFLAHYQCKFAAVLHIPFPGCVSHDGSRAARWEDYAGEKFERGGFSGSIWSEEGDEFAWFDAEGDSSDCFDGFIFAVEKPAYGFAEPLLFLVDAVGFCQLIDLNNCHGWDYSIPVLVRFPKRYERI